MAEPKKHILVVDDEPTWIKVLRYFLESRGYSVESVGSATEALSTLRTYHPDLILTDVRMPEMNGFDLLAKIRTMPETSKTPVVFFSAIDDYDARRTARRSSLPRRSSSRLSRSWPSASSAARDLVGTTSSAS